MIGAAFALGQVRRLKVTNFFAMLDDDGLGELARMLSFSETEIVAYAVINQWLEEQTERPTPADLRRLVALHNEARAADVEPTVVIWKCSKCQDTGMVGGDIGGEGARPWEWCDCDTAIDRREFVPFAVDEANAVRRRLMTTPRALKVVQRAHQDVEKVYRDV